MTGLLLTKVFLALSGIGLNKKVILIENQEQIENENLTALYFCSLYRKVC